MMRGIFYKDVLILSDNLVQCRSIAKVLGEMELLEKVNLTWACSVFSNPDKFSEQTGFPFRTLDLRVEQDVRFVTDHFTLVMSVHCKQIFPAAIVNKVKCINIHPGFNPENRGWYPQVFAILNDTVIGATIHEIDEALDHGPIICRKEVVKTAWDTSKTIYDKVLQAEIELFEECIEDILANNYNPFPPESEGRLYLKKDFNQLCKLDLNEHASVGEVLDKLRALTHGEYMNAYFIDELSGKKVFVSIDLKVQND